jgi:hypothetical protein
MRMEPTNSSETSAINLTWTPATYPKDNKLQLEHGESLKSRIIRLYGEEISRYIRLFKKLRMKKSKIITSLTFLLRCRDHSTIPGFLQFHHHIHSRAANRIYQRTSFTLLRERVYQNRRDLGRTSRDLLKTHLRLANHLSELDWQLRDRLTQNKATNVGESNKERQLNTLRTGDADLCF